MLAYDCKLAVSHFLAAFTRVTFLQCNLKIFFAWISLSPSGYSHEARLACRCCVWQESPPCKYHLRFAMPIIFCATRCNNCSRPWSLTGGQFQRLESPRAKSRSCTQQIVSNLQITQAQCNAQSFAKCWLRLFYIYFIKYCDHSTRQSAAPWP